MEKLKPCPFCGGKVKLVKVKELPYWTIGRDRREGSCRCHVYMEGRFYNPNDKQDTEDARNELVEAWNRRA